jgi:hypothetical protein
MLADAAIPPGRPASRCGCASAALVSATSPGEDRLAGGGAAAGAGAAAGLSDSAVTCPWSDADCAAIAGVRRLALSGCFDSSAFARGSAADARALTDPLADGSAAWDGAGSIGSGTRTSGPVCGDSTDAIVAGALAEWELKRNNPTLTRMIAAAASGRIHGARARREASGTGAVDAALSSTAPASDATSV